MRFELDCVPESDLARKTDGEGERFLRLIGGAPWLVVASWARRDVIDDALAEARGHGIRVDALFVDIPADSPPAVNDELCALLRDHASARRHILIVEEGADTFASAIKRVAPTASLLVLAAPTAADAPAFVATLTEALVSMPRCC